MGARRLAAHLRVAALRRLAEQAGGFATILHKGNAEAGDLLVILIDARQPSAAPQIFQPNPAWAPGGGWSRVAQELDMAEKLVPFLDKKRAIDPDLWIVELDIVDRQRFAERMLELV